MNKITDILKDKLKGFEYGYTAAYESGVSNANNKHTKATKSLNSTITFNEKKLKGLGFEIEILNLLFKSDIPVFNNIPLYKKSNIYWNVKPTESTEHQIDISILTIYGIILIECKNWDKNWSNDKYKLTNSNNMFEKIESIQKELIKTISCQYINAKKIFVFPNQTNVNSLTQELNKQRNDSISKNFIQVCHMNFLIDTISKFFYDGHTTITDDTFNKLNRLLQQQQSFDLTN